jgi:hypothetical protein
MNREAIGAIGGVDCATVRGTAGKLRKINGAQGRTRTDTQLPEPDFESGASTNFATRAGRVRWYTAAVGESTGSVPASWVGSGLAA